MPTSIDSAVSHPPSPPRQNYPGVDLLRALAATLVLAYHIVELGKFNDLPSNILTTVFRYGWVGVDLFLVISGFVIALSALSGAQRQGAGFRREFAIRRLARIAPLYLLTSALFLALLKPQNLFVSIPQLIAQLGSHLLFIHNLFVSTHGSINGPTWSIGLEMQFYLVMLLLAPWLIRVQPARLLFGALVVGVLWRGLTTLIWAPGSALPIIQFIYLTQLPGTIDQFAFGIAMALAVHHRNGFARRCLSLGWSAFFVWALLGSTLLLLAAWAIRTYSYWESSLMLMYWRPLLGAGFAALLGASLTLPVAGARLLAPIRYIGTISYGIYLWHMLVLISVTSWIPGLTTRPFATAVTVLTLILASLSWHLLEKPNIQLHKGG